MEGEGIIEIREFVRVGCKLDFGNALTHERQELGASLFWVMLLPTSFTKCKKLCKSWAGESKEEGRAKSFMFFCKACHENRTLLCGLEE